MSNRQFSYRAKSIDGPSSRFVPFEPSDETDLPLGLSRGLFVGQAGSFVAVDAHGAQVSFVSNAAQYHPLRVTRILATGTTASGFVALY